MSKCVSPRDAQVNIDSQTRQLTSESMHEEGARADAFEAAQRRIESLMEKDSYQRFLRSSHYLRLATSPTTPPASASASDGGASKPSKPRSFGERRTRGDGGRGGGAGEGKFGLLYVPGSGSGSEEETPTVESNALVESESSLSETPSAAFAPDGLLPQVCKLHASCGAMRRLYGSAASFDSHASPSPVDVRAAIVDASEITRTIGAESPHSTKSIATLAERNSSSSPGASTPQSSIDIGIGNGLGPPPEKGSTSALALGLARTGSDKALSVSDGHDTERQRTPTPTRSSPADDGDGDDEPNDMQVVATFIAELAV